MVQVAYLDPVSTQRTQCGGILSSVSWYDTIMSLCRFNSLFDGWASVCGVVGATVAFTGLAGSRTRNGRVEVALAGDSRLRLSG